MIMVDTSIWIDFFNGNNENEKVKLLEEYLNEGKDIYITDIILTEILQGFRDDNKYTIVKNSMLTLKFAHASNFETFIHASDIYRECRKKGITIRKTIDCLIAAVAIENGLSLLHKDNDFDNISKCIALSVI